MTTINNKLEHALKQREEDGALRKLPIYSNKFDFCSNDYLGFASSALLKNRIKWFYSRFEEKDLTVGSTGSRLITGNSKFIESLEEHIAQCHKAEAGLIFNSGYNANIGILSSVPQRGDTILYDELVHASIRDGIRLSFATNHSFKHNNTEHLKELLGKAEGDVFVVVEALYSMDGDIAPLKEILALQQVKPFELIVDEAHSVGIYGKHGEGICVELGIEEQIFARILTFGKALGCHGAIVIGSKTLREYLINFARSFIYTTALSTHSYIAIKCIYDLLPDAYTERQALTNNINLFIDRMSKAPHIKMLNSTSQIQGVIVPGNNEVKQISQELLQQGFDVRPILSPTVPKGSERIRICLHALNDTDEIIGLTRALYTVIKQ